MSKERLFYAKKNDSWHSYDFLRQRQNDPKWRQAFLEADALLEQEDKKRKRRNFIILLVSVPLLLIIVLVGLYFYGSSDEEIIPKREVSLNNSTSISSTITDASETIDTSSVGQVLTTPWGEQVTVLRVLSNGERVIKEGYSPSDLNGDGLLTFEELSKVEEQANQGNQQQYQQQTPQQGQNYQQEQYNQQQTPQQSQNNQQQTPQENQQQGVPNQSNLQQAPSNHDGESTHNQQNAPQSH
ncbi:hypothetical protein [Enterococcus sp. AZ196]|uniref:hypothetical protein n=1 Tax=Enterococcus sp. AZ196 TaxID=2774659 RepID=UPI003D2D13D7